MSSWLKIKGTQTGEIQLGFTGPILKNDNGNLDVRNSSNTALANITVQSIVANGTLTGNGALLTNINGSNVTGQVGNAIIAGTVYTNAQPNITSVGTLTSLAVTNSITAGNIFANTGTITANALSGTLTTAAQNNITSVGTLGSLTVTGNITGGNLTTTGVLTVSGTGVSSIAGNLDMTSNTIINLADPTNAQDAATKQYVDNIAQGLHVHAPVAAATPDTLANITVGTITYNNGSAGVGATLTTTGTFATIDGVNIASVGTRILVKNESNAAHNGIYTYTNSTIITRATDFDTPTEMAGGDFTFVQNGTTYNDTGWVMTDPVTTVGTSPVTFVQFSGAGTYTAGTGLTLTGTQFSISNTTVVANSYGGGDRVATFTVNPQGQLTAAANAVITANAANLTGTSLASTIVSSNLTSVGTLSSLSVNGNVTANFFIGDGSLLTNINGGNVSNVANANYANFAGTAYSVSGSNVSGQVGNALISGTVYTNAQPNITSVGNLTSLTVTGTSTLGNIGNVKITGGSNGYIITTDGSGNLNFIAPVSGDSAWKVDSTTVSFNSSASIIAMLLPANAIVDRVSVIVDTVFNGTAPTLSVGKQGGSGFEYSGVNDVNLKVGDRYDIPSQIQAVGSSGNIEILYSADGSTSGSARVLVTYAIPE